MNNVHGFGEVPPNRPNRNNPPPRNNRDDNNNRANDIGNGGMFGAFNQPVIEDQLRIAQ